MAPPTAVEVPDPPPTRTDDIVDTLHDTVVPDPYRWLEDGASEETRGWVAAQNARTEQVLGHLPGRDALHAQLSALLRAGSSAACTVAGARVFSLERWGQHDQAVLVVRSTTDNLASRTIVDPHHLTGDPTAAIDWYHPSPDGRLVAYGISTAGDERSTLHVLNVDTDRQLPDRIPNTRAASVAWLPDGTAFAYTRYPEPHTVAEDEAGYWRKVYWHRLGQHWRHDELIWDELPDKTAWANVSLSTDGRWLLVHLSLGWSRVDVHLIDRTTGSRTVMIEGIEAVSTFSVVGDEVIGITTLDADRGRLVSAPLAAAWHDNWCTLVPESERVLEAMAPTAESLLVLSSKSAVSFLDRYRHDGTDHQPIELPDVGSLAGLSGSRERDEAFFSFTSFATPPTTYRWAPVTPVQPPGHQATYSEVVDWSRLRDHDGHADGPTGDYSVEQVRYPSNDGTDITMFIVRAATTEPSTDTPCVLTGYGGFSITMGPAYSAAVVAVCDQGGIYAVANIRGGAEEGEAWHRAGMRENKQQTFDDFAAAADWLVDNRYTSRDQLAIRGGSNGGLLMGATITQRPDLCRAVQIAVPLLDMVRFHHFLIARLWIPEYGDPDNPADFEWLHGYSPYHRVVDGVCYPATLLTTAESDSRVDPMHARKMTARLQAATSCGHRHPILLREEVEAGHGQGKPVSKQADELADVLGFLLWQLGA
jgi:prolyl oligopeptidase